MIRYLLSHNHDISDDVAPPLTRDEFVELFQEARSLEPKYEDIQISSNGHPHWRCELKTELSPLLVGLFLADAVKIYRERTLATPLGYKVLILGGLKNTPATSEDPTALQKNEWGVDIVETADDKAFLSKINWERMTGFRPNDEILQVII